MVVMTFKIWPRPPGTPIALLPVAWTIGTDFKPTARRPASQITWIDHWGDTNAKPFDGVSLLAAQPGVTVEVDIAAPARREVLRRNMELTTQGIKALAESRPEAP